MFSKVWFYYKVKIGDQTPDLDYVDNSSLTLNGGTIKQYQGELDADLTLPEPGSSGSLGANKNIIINAAEDVNLRGNFTNNSIGGFQ